MNQISLQKVLPAVFANETDIQSDIWLHNMFFKQGETYLIEANSGTGKSSLCSYIYGYKDDYSGSILFDNVDIRTLKDKDWGKIHCTEISILFQELHLFPELTALENVQLKNNLTHHKTQAQINEMFALLDIVSKTHTKIAQMSWGQQQRVGIIRCLCQPFNYLILDEPISHLDDDNAKIIAELLHQEAKLKNATIISTSIGKFLPMNYTKIYSL